MKVIHIVTTATLLGFAFLGWLINYGRSHAERLQRNREDIVFMKTRISELEANVKKLEAKMVSNFPKPSTPSSSECVFDMVDGACTLNENLQVTGEFSANRGNENEDQSEIDSGAPEYESRWLT
jgi:hypothetical protein